MILTNCAACAAPLGLTLGKKCGRCSTRYCGPACQKQHWDGGHKEICKKIKKTGGAEQYNANKKYSEAVAVAAEKCADDTKGQACYICRESSHRRTKEGLVRGCACHTTEGFVHVSCLAEQAKLLVTEAEENYNLYGTESGGSSWAQWRMCSLCKQNYHGVVACALGWGCWKTYVGRPERDLSRISAMRRLGNGLSAAKHQEDALSVNKAELSLLQRLGASEESILAVRHNIAMVYQGLGRYEQALQMKRDVYSGRLRLSGEEHQETIRSAVNYGSALLSLGRFEETKSSSKKILPVARRVLGENHQLTLTIRFAYGVALYQDNGATLDDVREAVTTLEETERTARRVLGGAHPTTVGIGGALQDARAALRARETLSRGST